jgi:hypothetical protein
MLVFLGIYMSDILLEEWEKDDFYLDKDSIFIENEELTYVNDVKIHMIKNKLKHKFLNKLYDNDKISSDDYFYLMRWYYEKKNKKIYPITKEQQIKNNIIAEERIQEQKKTIL